MNRLGLIILFIVFSALQYRLWSGPGSLHEVLRLKKMVLNQTEEVSNLKKRNLALESELAVLKSGPHSLEERARAELGMIQQGETFYLVVSPNAQN